MSIPLNVHLLPSLLDADALSGGTAVIIDILRASSTMITALKNGATRVIPCGTTEEAFQVRKDLSPEPVLLGGERGGVKILGFDFGNSPAEYGSTAIAGHTVVFTTTNGTKAILKALPAEKILIGAFLNRKAVADRLRRERRSTHLICAGTDGLVTGEDVLYAGAIVDELIGVQRSDDHNASEHEWTLNDSAVMACSMWRKRVADFEDIRNQLTLAMRETHGGRNLISLGYDSDISLCSQLDQTCLVPAYDPQRHCLTASA